MVETEVELPIAKKETELEKMRYRKVKHFKIGRIRHHGSILPVILEYLGIDRTRELLYGTNRSS